MKKILTKIFLSLLVLVMMAGIIKTSFNVSVKASEEDPIVEQEDLNGEDENSDASTNGLPGLDDDGDGPNGIPQLGIIPDTGASTNGLPGLDDDGDGPNGIPQLGIEDDPEEENA